MIETEVPCPEKSKKRTRMRKLADHFMKWRVITIMPFLVGGWVWAWGLFASWLNHGKPLLDDPAIIYLWAMKCIPLFFCIMITMLASGMMNNSLTSEEYRNSAYQDKIADNLPEVIVFLACVIFFMFGP